MFGIGSSTGDSLQPMENVVGTYDKRHNSGTNNRGRYTNKDLDALIAKASRTMDPKAREELQRAAAADHHSRLRRREGRPMRTMRDILRAMVAAYEIQGLLAPENRFDHPSVGLDHVVGVKLASTAMSTALLGGSQDQIESVFCYAPSVALIATANRSTVWAAIPQAC